MHTPNNRHTIWFKPALQIVSWHKSHLAMQQICSTLHPESPAWACCRQQYTYRLNDNIKAVSCFALKGQAA